MAIINNPNIISISVSYKGFLSSFRGYISFILLYFSDELLTYRNIVFQTEHVPNSVPRQSLSLFEQSKALETLTGGLIFAKLCQWF